MGGSPRSGGNVCQGTKSNGARHLGASTRSNRAPSGSLLHPYWKEELLSALKKRRVIVTGAVVSCLVVLGLSAPSASAYDSGAKGPSTATTGPVPSPVRVDLPPTSASPIRLTSGDN